MGVHGLWRLLDATGKPVALETLEGKVLAVDVSIWLHQVMQGYQDGRGNPLPNAHLLGLFNRICKLLYYKIKPVFVFDGGVPLLKKNTIASRRKQKSMAASKAQRMKTDLINNLLKRTVVKGVLNAGNEKAAENGEPGTSSSQTGKKSVHSSLDLFKLPVIPSSEEFLSEVEDDPSSDSESSSQLSPRKQAKWIGNIHNVDVSSAEFKALPPDVRHDILTDLKATRKQNSWGRLHEMPEESHDFSNYQMKRLLKRRNVQECLEEAEKEMGGKTMTLEELDILLTEQGIDTTTHDKSSRIAGDNSTRFVYINGVKKDVRNIQDSDQPAGPSRRRLELDENVSNDEDVRVVENIEEYELDDDWESDWESDGEQEITVLKSTKFKTLMKASDINPAMAYMLEHSGLSQEEILCIIEQSRKKTKETFNAEMRSKTPDFVIKTEPREITSDEDFVQEESNIVTADSGDTNLRSTSPCNVSTKSDVAVEDFVNEEEVFPSKGGFVNVESNDKKEAKNGERDFGSDKTMSESDSDDFVEVEDVPPQIMASFNEKKDKATLEIAIAPELSLEDDMFADVFAKDGSIVKPKSPVPEEQVVEIEDKSKTHEIFDIIVGESIVEKQQEEITKDKICDIIIEKSIVENVEKETGFAEAEIISDTTNHIQQKVDSKIQEPGSEKKLNEETAIAETKKIQTLTLPIAREELLSMQGQLENEEKELTGNLGRLERQATDITDQMRLEAQELLKLFGIPYVIAPMEAEAQCAYLETINLTDGTITDDSDIWLFGGRCVYKNFFNLNKHVLQFRSCDIHYHFKLTREQMVQLALLVGSDYTVGVSGIGPVTALEILGAFPTEEGNLLRGLSNFRYWIHSGRAAGPGKASLRTKLKNIHVEKGFPSEAVVQAYLAPTVDESREGFTWNKPNATLLADFTREKFGWTKSKFEVIFNPIMKRQTEPQKQKGIDSYFQTKVSQKSIEGNLSKRVQKAVERLGGESVEDSVDDEVPEKRSRRQTKTKLGTLVEADKQSILDEASVVVGTAKTSKKTNNTQSELIPQRERDKTNALKKKLRAIEIFRKSKKGPGHTKKTKRSACKIKERAELSESSDST